MSQQRDEKKIEVLNSAWIQERVRRIQRTYKAAKKDITLVESGKRPVKPFIHDQDYQYWKDVVH